ncbi:hypothetical protein CYMTET_36996 [Cymbomonas tetramitiformis]|uniref:Uncharacterized protein n=1 Tax=Cymbomonas tetramitiformis TaxID=36881 RepID=A0AAE0ESE4_9CHLO|nr:hypothetical protein CYMTET_51405 [Cymbomonas tetramitiformis]KAK3253765.1 hypothetical protein CYMTET_36996 [Cymbomonas tetramitiformis]
MSAHLTFAIVKACFISMHGSGVLQQAYEKVLASSQFTCLDVHEHSVHLRAAGLLKKAYEEAMRADLTFAVVKACFTSMHHSGVLQQAYEKVVASSQFTWLDAHEHHVELEQAGLLKKAYEKAMRADLTFDMIRECWHAMWELGVLEEAYKKVVASSDYTCLDVHEHESELRKRALLHTAYDKATRGYILFAHLEPGTIVDLRRLGLLQQAYNTVAHKSEFTFCKMREHVDLLTKFDLLATACERITEVGYSLRQIGEFRNVLLDHSLLRRAYEEAFSFELTAEEVELIPALKEELSRFDLLQIALERAFYQEDIPMSSSTARYLINNMGLALQELSFMEPAYETWVANIEPEDVFVYREDLKTRNLLKDALISVFSWEHITFDAVAELSDLLGECDESTRIECAALFAKSTLYESYKNSTELIQAYCYEYGENAFPLPLP